LRGSQRRERRGHIERAGLRRACLESRPKQLSQERRRFARDLHARRTRPARHAEKVFSGVSLARREAPVPRKHARILILDAGYPSSGLWTTRTTTRSSAWREMPVRTKSNARTAVWLASTTRM